MGDDGWDQPAVLVLPNATWLTPYGEADRLVALSAHPSVLEATWMNLTWGKTSLRNSPVDAHAASTLSGVVLRVVNTNETVHTVKIVLPGCNASSASVLTLHGSPMTVFPAGCGDECGARASSAPCSEGEVRPYSFPAYSVTVLDVQCKT